MTHDPVNDLASAALAGRDAAGLRRRRRMLRPLDAVHVEIDGERYINFSSNNYLGLTHHARVIDAIARAAREFGAGAAASPLISGHTTLHAAAERALAQWKGTESAVLLPSGYQANHAAIQTIAAVAAASGQRVRFLLDKFAHASLIDAVRGAGLPPRALRVFPHNDLGKLQRLLERRDVVDDSDDHDNSDDTGVDNRGENAGRADDSPGDAAGDDEIQVVVTESIFSMDGDAAPLRELAALKRKHRFLLLLDEAHGSGVYGEHGAGYAAECGVSADVDVTIVTLSKSLGCAGGAICASETFCDALPNFGRAYVYSTAVPPMIPAAAEAALAVMRDEPHRQQRLRRLAGRVREQLGLPLGDSPIVPLILGPESAALAAAAALARERLLVLPVRPPTVPRGTARLRITLSCEHTDDEVERLVASLLKLRQSR